MRYPYVLKNTSKCDSSDVEEISGPDECETAFTSITGDSQYPMRKSSFAYPSSCFVSYSLDQRRAYLHWNTDRGIGLISPNMKKICKTKSQ